jgi:hypothetical protein
VLPEQLRPTRDYLDGQHAGGDEGCEAERDIDFARAVSLPGKRQNQAAKQGDAEDVEQRFQVSPP